MSGDDIGQGLLEVGKVADLPFSLPITTATQASAIVGIRGSGKTTTATVLVEELLRAGVQAVVVDPLDAWWGLKSSRNGASAGCPVAVLGGAHGDLPLASIDGRVLADLAVEERIPMVLSLRHLRRDAQRQLIADFAEQLYFRKGEEAHRTPVTVVIDEASLFVPQKATAADRPVLTAIEDLVRRGRSSGIGVVLIDQRPATVNKDVLTQAELLVAHRTPSPHDRKAIKDWMAAHSCDGRDALALEQVASLPTGTAWFWAPAIDAFERVAVRDRRTFDSSSTPTLGTGAAAPVLASVNLESLRARLFPPDEPAGDHEGAADAGCPIASAGDLDEEARLIRAIHASAMAMIEAEIAAPLQERIEELEAQLGAIARIARRLGRAVQGIEDDTDDHMRIRAYEAAAEVVTDPAKVDETLKSVAWDPPLAASASTARRRASRRSSSPTGTAAAAGTAPGSLPAVQQRILDALATYEAFGQVGAAREAVAAVAGYRIGGSFNVATARLRDAGLVETADSGLQLTAGGRARAHPRDFKSRRDVHRAWMDLLSSAEQRVLTTLLDAYPNALSRDELAARSGFRVGGSFNVAVARLRKMGAATASSSGTAAAKLLFPKGLRA